MHLYLQLCISYRSKLEGWRAHAVSGCQASSDGFSWQVLQPGYLLLQSLNISFSQQSNISELPRGINISIVWYVHPVHGDRSTDLLTQSKQGCRPLSISQIARHFWCARDMLWRVATMCGHHVPTWIVMATLCQVPSFHDWNCPSLCEIQWNTSIIISEQVSSNFGLYGLYFCQFKCI